MLFNDENSWLDDYYDNQGPTFGNEHQAAYDLSRREREPDDSAKVAELGAQGRYVVVATVTEYCRFTDAILGVRACYVSDHETEEEAVSALPDDCDDELYAVLGPKKHQPEPKPVRELPVDEDDIPF